jgi:desulfoferrodoxin-like iron-binding protein
MNTGADMGNSPLNASLRGVQLQEHPAEGRVTIMVNVSKEGQIFKCEICGNVVVVKEAGGGELVCCGEPMQLEE